jgi:hypothetical protein
VLTRLSGEDDGVDTLNLHAGGIPKLDGASDIGVKLSEELPSIGYVMGGTGVEAPPVSLVAGDNSMLACARSRAGSSSSTYATWAWPRRGC